MAAGESTNGIRSGAIGVKALALVTVELGLVLLLLRQFQIEKK